MAKQFRLALSPGFTRGRFAELFSGLTEDKSIEVSYIENEKNAAGDPVITAASLEDVDALILGLEQFHPASVPGNNALKLIARFGVGYNTVDIPTATEHGVAVVTTPNGVRRPVATAVITFLLALTMKLLEKDRIPRQGAKGWRFAGTITGVGLVGRTLGVLGMGSIGAEVFRLAAPFGLKFMCDTMESYL